jgi:alpha-tubulin suppressor-like RCC1 family protein
MRVDYIQGILAHPNSLGQQVFLAKTGDYISLQTANGITDITFAHRVSDYLFTENVDVNNAWGPLLPDTDYWLYWDIDLRTAVRTFGFTTIQPTYGPYQPVGIEGLHWFNTTTHIMYAYISGGWRERVRVFAAKVNNTSIQGLGTGLNSPGSIFVGSQVRLNAPSFAGRIIADDSGTPIKRADGIFFTTETNFFINSSPINNIKLEANVNIVTANQNIAKYTVVKYSNFGHISTAVYNDIQQSLIALSLEDVAIDTTGTVCLQGLITNPDWNFQSPGAELWVDDTGLLTTVDLHVTEPLTHPVYNTPIARVVSPTSIYFAQGLGGKGDTGAGAGASSPLATTSIYGISKLSIDAVDIANPIVVGDNDPRLLPSMVGNINRVLTTNGSEAIWSGTASPFGYSIWGSGTNYHGAIGNNSSVSYVNIPTHIASKDTDWKNVNSLGGTANSTTATKTDGTLWTWGDNTYGQLGDGTIVSKSSPIQIGLLNDWAQVSSGSSSATITAIKTDGTLWAWGDNYGAFGDGTDVSQSSPIQIGSLHDWAYVSNNNYNSAAIKTDGTLWTWGAYYGVIFGDPLVMPKLSPVQIGSLTDWAQVSCGYMHMTAIKTGGTLWTWGYNYDGQLGDGTTIDKSSPVQVGSLTDWASVSCGDYHTEAIKTDGTLWAWGHNGSGRLGDGTTVRQSSPVQIGSLTDWTQVSCGSEHTVALRSDNTAWSWGKNLNGQLGDGTIVSKSSPVQTGVSTWTHVRASSYSTNLVGEFRGTVQFVDMSGGNTGLTTLGGPIDVNGQFTLGGTLNVASGGTNANTANTAFNNLAPTQTVNSGKFLTTSGTNTSWDNVYSEYTLYSSPGTSPIQISSSQSWKHVAEGGGHWIAVKTDGTLWAWGDNTYGQLGDGTIVNQLNPIQIGSLTNWEQVCAESFSSSAIKTDGTLWTWGQNNMGQLGDGTYVSKSSPTQVGSLTTWKQVSMEYHTAAVKTDGTLWGWGEDYSGSFLGSGPFGSTYSSPIQIGSLTNWSQVSCGGRYTTAIKTDGTLWAWGYNANGEVGNGTSTPISSPIQIGLLTNWSQVSAGLYNYESTAAIKTDGTLWMWGSNNLGKLGDNTVVPKSSPIQIGALTNWKQVPRPSQSTAAAVKTDGTMWTWGKILGYGAIGYSKSSPTQVGAGTHWMSVDLGLSNLSSIGIVGKTIPPEGGGTGLKLLGSSLQVLRTNAAADAIEWATPVYVGGSTTQFQYNNAGTIAGATNLTTDGTNVALASGNLNFNSTGQRITGELSSGTATNRLAFQSSVINGATYLNFIPNGTSTDTALNLYNGSDINNSGYFYQFITTAYCGLNTTHTGSGVTRPFGFYIDASLQLQIPTGVAAVNYATIQGSIANSPVTIGAAGTSTNIGINLTPKGTGGVGIGSSAPIFFAADTQLQLYNTTGTNAAITSTTGNSGLVLNGGSSSGGVSYIDFRVNGGTLRGNIAVNNTNPGLPLELNSATTNNVVVAGGGGKVMIGLVSTPSAILHIKAGTTAANTAPLKFTSGALMTNPEAGAVEFLTDAYYGTITTGAARKQFAFTDSNITGNAANVSGTVLYTHGGTGLTALGTANQVLRTNASATAAEWATVLTGTAVLVGGTVTVSQAAVTANSIILLTSQVDGGTVGFLRISARVDGVSFTITSSNALDTSTVAWQLSN